MVAIAIFDLLQILTMHTDGKILGIINNVKCCFLHDDAFLQENFFVDWNTFVFRDRTEEDG